MTYICPKIPRKYFLISSYGAYVIKYCILEAEIYLHRFKKFRILFVEDIVTLTSSALSNSLPVTIKKGWIFKVQIPNGAESVTRQ